jgi:signal transduction histidine kinase
MEQRYKGADFSSREYFTKPRDTLIPFYGTVVQSIDNVPRLYIGYPISENRTNGEGPGTFGGVVVAAIGLDAIGNLLQQQLLPTYKNTVGLLDRNGVIVYSSNTTYEGLNFFSTQVQTAIPSDIQASFDQFVRDSLKGNTGSGEFSENGVTSTIAYEPVKINGSDFAILYVVTPHQLAGSTVSLFEQQRTLNFVIIVAVGAVALGVAVLVLIWNSRLTKTVAAWTFELKSANESLIDSNRQLAEANELLKVHDKLQKEFVNVAAHELRTPIQPLIGAAELMDSQFAGREKIEVTKPEIEMILRNAKRLERLSTDILEISRVERGALKLNIEDFSLAYVIANAVKDAKGQSTFDPDKLAITYSHDDIFIHEDKEKITQVISNLLSNAIKFTKEGTISITTQKINRDRDVLVQIRDSGTGLDPEIVPKLFEKFVTKSEKGTGIGLYICKNIVEAHGGKIYGENNRDTPGSTFKFQLLLEQPVKGANNEPKSQSAIHGDVTDGI